MTIADSEILNVFPKIDETFNFFSENGAEMFVIIALSEKRKGLYLDIGCSDPVKENNTLSLENSYDWNGINVIDVDDPKEPFQTIKRKSATVIADIVKHDYKTFLKKESGNYVDYLSFSHIDSKKSLKSLTIFPLSKVDFSIITFKHLDNKNVKSESRKIIQSYGYKLLCSSVGNKEDWYYSEKLIKNDNLKIFESKNKNWKEIFLKLQKEIISKKKNIDLEGLII